MKLKYEFITTEIGDHTVAIPVGEAAQLFNGVMHINDSAKEILTLLSEDITYQQIIEKLTQKYIESTKEEIVGFVDGFLEKLKQEDLLV
jgi:hypothetical protein